MAYRSQVTITRPADTTAYAAGDVVGISTSAGGAVLTFTNAGPESDHLVLTDASLMVNLSAVPAGMTSFRLHLYASAPASNLADNDAWDLAAADRSAYLGFIDIGSPADFGSTLWCEVNGVNKRILMADGASSMVTTLWGYLVTNGAYTPGSGDVMEVTIGGLRLSDQVR